MANFFPYQLCITCMHFETSSSFDWFIRLFVFEQETLASAPGDAGCHSSVLWVCMDCFGN